MYWLLLTAHTSLGFLIDIIPRSFSANFHSRLIVCRRKQIKVILRTLFRRYKQYQIFVKNNGWSCSLQEWNPFGFLNSLEFFSCEGSDVPHSNYHLIERLPLTRGSQVCRIRSTMRSSHCDAASHTANRSSSSYNGRSSAPVAESKPGRAGISINTCFWKTTHPAFWVRVYKRNRNTSPPQTRSGRNVGLTIIVSWRVETVVNILNWPLCLSPGTVLRLLRDHRCAMNLINFPHFMVR